MLLKKFLLFYNYLNDFSKNIIQYERSCEKNKI